MRLSGGLVGMRDEETHGQWLQIAVNVGIKW